jgi:hypothetical protein
LDAGDPPIEAARERITELESVVSIPDKNIDDKTMPFDISAINLFVIPIGFALQFLADHS